MRTKTISISERYLMFVIGGQLFDQAPNHQPRKAEIIMQKVRDAFREEAYNDNEFYTLQVEENGLYDYLKDLLMGIPEFVELNLTQVEFDGGISVDDGSRGKYSFTSRYDKHTSESWKHDFIDLDAFIGNVRRRLINIMNMDQDCFCCKHEGKCKDIEPCRDCMVRPDLKNNLEYDRRPKGKFTFSCKFDCYRNYQICCEECKKKESCDKVCDGKSETCGNRIVR